MKKLFPLLLVILLLGCKKDAPSGGGITPVSDSFNVTVSNGYGSGKYKTGDTVHIFSVAFGVNQLFDTWNSADATLLNGKDEWHSWFIMPSKNVSFTGGLRNISPVTLVFEQIRGRDRLKPVYSFFPPAHKGFVLLLHGSGGTAQHFVNSYEYQQLIKELIADNFAVIITEAEEATTGIDTDGDAKLRWATVPYDSATNVDYANIKIITDTFYNRGITNRGKLRFSVGMSNGGNFSSYLSALFKYKAATSYCAPSGSPIAAITTTPLQFCMARFDNHENVGPVGNANALANSQALTSRAICSKYLVQEHSPLYPERFARKGDITIAKSILIFNELKAKGFLDNKNYFIGFSGGLTTAYQANPTSFPELNSLTVLQKLTVVEQVDLAVADHQMFSDYNRATLKFLNSQCQ
jgi:hypothetical protein